MPDDYAGRIERVEFFQGDTLLGTDTDASNGWSFDWTDLPPGSHTISVRAIDNDAQSAWSPPIVITALPAK